MANNASVMVDLVDPTPSNQPAQMKGLDGYDVTPIFTIGEIFEDGSQGDYFPPGILDGLGAYTLEDGNTIRVLANHELRANAGYSYSLANGTELTGARVSFFDIDKNSLELVDVGLAYNTIINRLGEIVDDASDLELGGINRLCSAQYIEAYQFGNGIGLQDGMFFTGEEGYGGTEFVIDVATNTMYAVPWMGRAAWESVTEINIGDSEKVALLVGDDRQAAPLLLYVGNKGDINGDGTIDFLERNGLAGGELYVWVANSGEITPEEFNGTGQDRDGTFVKIEHYDLDQAGTAVDTDGDGSIQDEMGYDEQGFATQAQQDFLAEEAGAFKFSRPEDVATNPFEGTEIVLASTGRGGLFPSDNWGTTYRIDVDFGSEITANAEILYDGDDAGNGQFAGPDYGLRSPDNLDWADDGMIYIQEDRSTSPSSLFGGTSGKEASIWKLDPDSGILTRVAEMDRTAVPEGQTDSDPDDIGDWESSGIIDVSTLFEETPGTRFIFDVQAHSLRDGIIETENLVQGGQLAFLTVQPELVGYAELPADTFAEGPPSGNFINSNNRETPFDSQPVQGFSGVQFATKESYWFLSDNGFGAKSNSADYLLRIYKVDPDFVGTEDGDGTVEVQDFIQLSDPNHLLPFDIVNEDTSDRLLTGADFDIESIVLVPEVIQNTRIEYFLTPIDGKEPATDSASSGTAMSTGYKTDAGNIAWLPGDSEDGALTTIAESLKADGFAIGIGSTVPFSHATPSAFISHNVNRNNYQEIGSEIVNVAIADVVIGGGNPNTYRGGGNYRYLAEDDYNNLKAGNTPYTHFVEWEEGVDGNVALIDIAADVDVNAGEKLFGYFGGYGGNFDFHEANNDPGNPNITQGAMENPLMKDMVLATLDVITDDPDGSFAMFEQGDIDWANHSNDYENMIGGVWDLDQAVIAAEDFVDQEGDNIDWSNTLFIVTSDHSNSYLRNLEELAAGELPLQIVNENAGNNYQYGLSYEGAFVYPDGEVSYGTGNHTNELVTVSARGAGAELFNDYLGRYPDTQIVDNTDIYNVMKRAVEESGAEHIVLFVGDGMNLEHEVAASRYLYGEDYGLAWHDWDTLPSGWEGYSTTYDVTTYNKYASVEGVAEYDPNNFDPNIGYDVSKGGYAPSPVQPDSEFEVVIEEDIIWIGDEFGPFLLKFDSEGVLLDLVETPNITNFNTLNGQDPLVIAHRGASGYLPEHTLEAYAMAIEMGADFIEPDLVTTADGVLIARHEPLLDDTTNVAEVFGTERMSTKMLDGVEVTGYFAEDFTLAEIKTLRAVQSRSYRPQEFNGLYEIPTFAEIIDLVQQVETETDKEIGIYPETKHPTFFDNQGLSLEEKVIDELVAQGFTDSDRIFIQSFEIQNLLDLQELLNTEGIGDIPLVQLYGDTTEGADPNAGFSAPYDVRYNVAEGNDLSAIYGDLTTIINLSSDTVYGDLDSPEVLQWMSDNYAEGAGTWKNNVLLRESIDPPVDGDGDGNAEITSQLTGEITPFVDDAHDAALQVHPYTMRNEERFLTLNPDGSPQTPEEEYEQLIQVGFDGFFTDFTDTAVSVVEPITAEYVQSPDNPFLESPEQANLPRSRGFEGMGSSPDGSTLYPMLEGTVQGDPEGSLRIYEFDLITQSYSDELAGLYQMDAPNHAIGDLTPINNTEFLVIERDGGQGETAEFKKIFKIDISNLDENGFVEKKLVVDLLNIADPHDLNGDGETTFTFPFVTIEDVLIIDEETILVANDNNYPFSIGRPETGDIDNTEIIQIKLPTPLNLDDRLGVDNAPEEEEVISFPKVVTGSPEDDYFDSAFPDDQQFVGDEQTLFTGSGNDMVDASQIGEGNRIDLGSGDDWAFIGTNNRVIAGAGDDILFAGAGEGNNQITTGSGYDQVWLITDIDAIPEDINLISDFDSDYDLIGFANTGLTMADKGTDWNYQQSGNNVIISAFEQDIAQLNNTTVTDANFIFA